MFYRSSQKTFGERNNFSYISRIDAASNVIQTGHRMLLLNFKKILFWNQKRQKL